ncbi:MAG: cell division protein FtsZ [Alphaproteobacteria bacterium]
MIDIKMQPTEIQKLSPKISVIGVGGAGGNAVNNMMASNLEGCDFAVANTDAQALENSLAEDSMKIQLGVNVTGGLGAGSKPEIGKAAAEESIEDLLAHVEGANMVFVTAGMGGGTGTGAAPVIAKACRDRGILTVGVVTKPFHFEGSHRMKAAEAGIEEMQGVVDTLIVIPNQNLFRVANENTTFADAFQMADSVLQAGVKGVTDLIVRPGLVNLDFADIRTGMLEMGKAMMGTGEAEGEKRAIEAAESAINNPLLDDVSMKGAHGVIINVTGGYDMTLFEADEACNRIRDEVDPDANIIFGATFDQSLEGKMRVSIVATGIEKEVQTKRFGGSGSFRTDGTTGGGGGGGKPVLERATPNTSETAGIQQPNFMPAQNIGIGAAAAQSGHPVTASPAFEAKPAPAAETNIDMFEQQEFAQNTGETGEAIPQNTVMRGTRYKNAFIPPKPVDGGRVDQGGYISNFHGAHVPEAATTQPAAPVASAPTVQATAPATPALNLKPPKLPSQQEKKRTPSLFERITGSVQETIENLTHREEEEPRQRTAPTAPSAPVPPTQAARTAPPMSQGSLNIDSPSKPAEGESELDIPAFLRRQAN